MGQNHKPCQMNVTSKNYFVELGAFTKGDWFSTLR